MNVDTLLVERFGPIADPRHGTVAGYRSGCHDDCCRHANTRYDKQRRLDKLRGIERTLAATGTIRRIEALHRMGWTLEHIAEHGGWDSFQAVNRIKSRTRITRTTANRIAATYDALCMTPGPSAAARRRAERLGYAPPLAWLDIDDPDEIPDAGYKPTKQRKGADLLAEYEHLIALGESTHQAALLLGVTVEAIEKAASRREGAA